MRHATHVLLATAIRDHAYAYEAALERHGIHVHIARTGEDAMAAAIGHPPDCIVIDLRLPDTVGWELCARLKRTAEVRAVPVIILTRDIGVDQSVEGTRAGCDAWMARPTVAEDLVEAIGEVLHQAQAEPGWREGPSRCARRACPACASSQLHAALRISPIQNFRCLDCGCYWRVEMVPAEQSA